MVFKKAVLLLLLIRIIASNKDNKESILLQSIILTPALKNTNFLNNLQLESAEAVGVARSMLINFQTLPVCPVFSGCRR